MTAPSLCAVVAGPCEVWVDTGVDRALEFLGWSVGGISIEEQAYHTPIYSDQNGGDQGPPSDYQLFGHLHRIAMELSKFQDAVLSRLSPRINPATLTSNVGPGMLVGCSAATFRLLLKAPAFIRNYPATVILDPIDIAPVGSQASRARLTFTANVTPGGVLWNTTTT